MLKRIFKWGYLPKAKLTVMEFKGECEGDVHGDKGPVKLKDSIWK